MRQGTRQDETSIAAVDRMSVPTSRTAEQAARVPGAARCQYFGGVGALFSIPAGGRLEVVCGVQHGAVGRAFEA